LRAEAEKASVLIGANADRPVSEYEPKYAETLSREFSLLSTTAPTWMIIHPEANRWDFSLMDAAVEFAGLHGMKVLGNNVLWGARGVDAGGKETWNNYPKSYVNDKLSADTLRKTLKDHVTTLLARYKGKVHEWIVVNGALEDAPGKGGGFRQDVFARKLGALNYVVEAFKTAHEADPDAVLILNESGAAGLNEKSNRLYNFTKELLKRGAPVHAVGFEMHFRHADRKPPDFPGIAKNLQRFEALGVKIKFTETDVAMGDTEQELRGYAQSQIYRGIMDVCLGSKACDEVTFWGFTDKHNWYADELEDKDEEPLLFDVVYRKKPAYFAILGALTSPRPAVTPIPAEKKPDTPRAPLKK
jgi:endo-1,4-beta-xylanase